IRVLDVVGLREVEGLLLQPLLAGSERGGEHRACGERRENSFYGIRFHFSTWFTLESQLQTERPDAAAGIGVEVHALTGYVAAEGIDVGIVPAVTRDGECVLHAGVDVERLD